MRRFAMLAALVGLSSVAIAGDHYRPRVHVTSYRYDGVTYGSAYGSLTGASESPDDMQYITCTTSKYNYDGVTQFYGFCVAVDKNFDSASCYTEDTDMIDIIHSMGEQTEFGFAAIDGTCTNVWAANGSQYLE
jgi:hypothetical protein